MSEIRKPTLAYPARREPLAEKLQALQIGL
jgi:hypothetical protein